MKSNIVIHRRGTDLDFGALQDFGVDWVGKGPAPSIPLVAPFEQRFGDLECRVHRANANGRRGEVDEEKRPNPLRRHDFISRQVDVDKLQRTRKRREPCRTPGGTSYSLVLPPFRPSLIGSVCVLCIASLSVAGCCSTSRLSLLSRSVEFHYDNSA